MYFKPHIAFGLATAFRNHGIQGGPHIIYLQDKMDDRSS